jgi:hypothetical protein
VVLAEENRPAYDRVRLSAWFDDEPLALDPVDGRDGAPGRARRPDSTWPPAR